MELYNLPAQQNSVPAVPRTVALGLFDGLHSGHRAVIAEALKGDGRCAVYTFDPTTVTTKPGARWLLTTEEMGAKLDKIGVQELFVCDFTSVQSMTPAQFVEKVLVQVLHAQTVVCGFNYRFGAGGSGDTHALTDLCAAYGITVKVVPSTTVDGEPISSTAIRRALADGNMEKARRMLSYAYRLRLPVMHGQHLGRQLGMPTINQVFSPEQIVPRFGVYASAVEIGDTVYHGVTNIGLRPTVGADKPLAETWIDGFDGDIYGQTVAVYPVKFLREERKFDTLEALQEQVTTDAQAARAVFTPTGRIRAVLFDFDDTLHKRDDAFSQAVDRFTACYYPENAQKDVAKNMIRYNGYGYGMAGTFLEFVEKFLPETATVSPKDALRKFFIAYASSCVLEPDAVPTLGTLRQQGLLLGVITNGGSLVQNGKVDMTGLRPLLDIATVGGDESVQKPNPAIFRKIAARLGVACEDCVYVGDHPLNDITGAMNAGMRAVYIEYGRPADHPCYRIPLPAGVPVIHSLSELPPVLETLYT